MKKRMIFLLLCFTLMLTGWYKPNYHTSPVQPIQSLTSRKSEELKEHIIQKEDQITVVKTPSIKKANKVTEVKQPVVVNQETQTMTQLDQMNDNDLDIAPKLDESLINEDIQNEEELILNNDCESNEITNEEEQTLEFNPEDLEEDQPLDTSINQKENNDEPIVQEELQKTVTQQDLVTETSSEIIDLTSKLDQFMKQNAAFLQSYRNRYGYFAAAVMYYVKVTDGGDWDIKLQDEWKFQKGKTYVYQGKELRMDDPGNIHFGYVGAILFSEEFVCFGAGANNVSKFGFTAGNLQSYYDDPQDQEMMRWGYRLYKQGYLR